MYDGLAQFWEDHPEYNGCEKLFCVQTIPFLNLTGGATKYVTNYAQIGIDGDFVGCEIRTQISTAITDAALIDTVPILAMLIDGGANENMTDKPTEQGGLGCTAPNFVGTVFPYPSLHKKRTRINAAALNASGTNVNFYLSVLGIKVIL